jgi:hypothetical protein
LLFLFDRQFVPIHAQMVTSHALRSRGRSAANKRQHELFRLWGQFSDDEMNADQLLDQLTGFTPF